MALSVSDIRADLDLMEASDTDVFFRFSTTKGKSDKTDVMPPDAARAFLDTAEFLNVEFTRIWMGRAEQF